MSLEKREPYRNPKLLAFAKQCPCLKCGRHDGTTQPCHYAGIRAFQLGKGKAQKCDDDCIAFLCPKCHRIMDNYKNAEDPIERSEEFLYYVVRSMNLLHRIGFEF